MGKAVNLNVTSMAFLTAGIVLLYAALKNVYPQDVLRQAMGKDPIHGAIVGPSTYGRKLQPSTLSPGTGVVIATV